MTQPARFRQEDVKRAAAGAKAAGIIVGRVEISPNGHIIVHAAGMASSKRNPLDRLFDTP